ncbi:TetR/AcrR family transcriptional regulator [Microbacterium sp. C7(2022)]|uniref:TetR/AcrR family transcriptional regulator n=1 Tax=Microbacterium sp. C7(2022) TaxID=2992759 RepID=UPI00237B1D47|nr:helix-turn-helix domain-containing protein [Microbacterium sp. C7(2022)]MDE0546166.1 TetR/AcrR family transcriptional regulator [Microbacterium sp. C7(2022)]
MSDATATSPRREATRQKLLDAAAQVFAEVGLDAASVEAVCDRAGFTRGAFYSNFESKDELFLELSARVAFERVESVRRRVAELEGSEEMSGVAGAGFDNPEKAFALVQQILDVAGDDRLTVLLMSEIRIHALRDRNVAEAYLAQEQEMFAAVAQIIDDIACSKALTFRVPPDRAARAMLVAWESASVRAVMAGLEPDEMRLRVNEELAIAAQLIIASAA